ncbi:DUF1648 domain-containing protein [Nocardioides sp. AE5]|uniref:DUF1648 domain-containing protein n=1 Tax=Nocardioides sp. AE5 TaxID=2962573 RepID=UPI002882C5B3|nr:DUF1648 domain-containing protein [Nocardioides sp. AE5]MDT0200766.1 DUF1648 domain-containing protein [Nocardioides sp. AE5]
MIGLYRTCIVAYLAALAWAWWRLPEQIPVRFDDDGEPTQWRSLAFVVTVFVVIGLLAVAAVEVLLRKLPARADRLGLPHHGYWTRAENLPGFRSKVRDDVAFVGAAMLLLLVALVHQGVRAVEATRVTLGSGGTIAVLAFAMAVLIRLTWMFTSRYRPPRRS